MNTQPHRHFPPPPPLPARVRPFQRVPPAVFTPILGFYGLGIAWRAGHGLFRVPAGPVEFFLGAVSLLFLFALVAYAVKVFRRPGVVAEDARTLPGRAGLAALTMGLMLLAAALLPYAPAVAEAILYSGFVLHVALGLHVLVRMLRAPGEIGPPSPALHMVFVGVIVSPVSAIPLGQEIFVLAVLYFSLAASMIVYAITLPRLLRKSEPAPLRPLHAIHLAPAGLIASAAALVGQDGLAVVMLALTSMLFGLLVWRLRWIVEGGFSGFWGAFTFPLAAFAGAWIAAHQVHGWEVARTVGGLAMVISTLLIPLIAGRVLRMWADGSLAAKTNAAIA